MKELSEMKSTYEARLAEQINKTIQSDEEISSWRSKLRSTENELTSSRNKTGELMKELSVVKSTYEALLAEQVNKTIQMDEEIRSLQIKLHSTEKELHDNSNGAANTDDILSLSEALIIFLFLQFVVIWIVFKNKK
ncbi:uncharacterized protein LOC119078431 [Bradysia coprophila]|uniref:uncharacterized protein LOC119078431 n=1 Tax=Bradysia coprophila TaxID=38358 RepID=UPI00187D7586|nr:uncharacterized protein LOC119078431 [Bradysia coprophila]